MREKEREREREIEGHVNPPCVRRWDSSKGGEREREREMLTHRVREHEK